VNLYREALEKRRTLLKQRATLEDELDRSLAIQDLWPAAFDHGSASSRMSGSIHSSAEFLFIIKNGLGEERSFPFWTIPLSLIDYHLSRLLQTIDPRRHGEDTADRIRRMRRELDSAGRV